MNRGIDKFPHSGDRIGANAYIPLPFDGWQTKMQIASYWDQVAPRYSLRQRHFFENEKDRAVVKWKLLFHDLIGTRSTTVLDAGCGPGLFSVMLCELGHIVTGIDLSHPMIAAAREFTSEKKTAPTLKRGDLEFLLFDDASFDLVLCCDVLWSVLHPGRVIHEFRRVLRPGGRVILIDRVARVPYMKYFNSAGFLSTKIPSGSASPGMPKVSLLDHESTTALGSFSQRGPSYDMEILKRGGFEEITQNSRLEIPSIRYTTWVETVFFKSILITAVKRLDG
nr:class I SAM-dependent methyltransferase [uncultured Methanospirillum sp.]